MNQNFEESVCEAIKMHILAGAPALAETIEAIVVGEVNRRLQAALTNLATTALTLPAATVPAPAPSVTLTAAKTRAMPPVKGLRKPVPLDVILQAVEGNPGARASAIRAFVDHTGVAVSSWGLRRGLEALRKRRRIRLVGRGAQTRYFPMGK